MINTVYSKETISDEIHTKWAGKTVHFAKETDSTNEWCKRMSKEGAEHGTLAVAEFQSAGKGRLGRRWTAPEGSSVMMSILLRPEFEPQYASMLTLVMGLSVAQAVKELDVEVSIKWPNDVIASGKKLCGILTESSSDLEYINYVVVGIGVNCNQTEFPEEIREIASSICLETGRTVDRTRLLAEFFNCFEVCYETFLETEDLQGLVEDYNARLINRGKEVKIVEKEKETVLKAVGVDQHGGLIVEDAEGKRRSIISGEVSVRGLYGYV